MKRDFALPWIRRSLTSPSVPFVAGLLGLATMMFLAFLWYSFSPILGRFYTGVRIAETLSAWRFTDWGAYFTSVPAGQPFAFIAIYKSSVSFGVFFALITGVIGLLAYRKVQTQHLDVLMAEPKGGLTAESAFRSLQGTLPHLRAETLKFPTAPLRLPEQNPFATVKDLRDQGQVSDAVAGLSWAEAAVIVQALSAIAPMKDRKPGLQVDKMVWQIIQMPPSTKRAKGDQSRGVEPSNRDRVMITLTLIEVVSRTDGRDTGALDKAHKQMKRARFTQDAICALAKQAQKESYFPLERTAWLRFIDPLLHDRIAHADQEKDA